MSRNIDTTIARARTLLVAIDEALICNPDPARIAELLTDAYMNPWSGDMRCGRLPHAAAARIAELERELAAAEANAAETKRVASYYESQSVGWSKKAHELERELAAALTQAVEQAEAWEAASEKGGES